MVGVWGQGRTHADAKTRTVMHAGRHPNVQLVEQKPTTRAGADATHFTPHLSTAAAHGARQTYGKVDRHLGPFVSLTRSQPHFGGMRGVTPGGIEIYIFGTEERRAHPLGEVGGRGKVDDDFVGERGRVIRGARAHVLSATRTSETLR